MENSAINPEELDQAIDLLCRRLFEVQNSDALLYNERDQELRERFTEIIELPKVYESIFLKHIEHFRDGVDLRCLGHVHQCLSDDKEPYAFYGSKQDFHQYVMTWIDPEEVTPSTRLVLMQLFTWIIKQAEAFSLNNIQINARIQKNYELERMELSGRLDKLRDDFSVVESTLKTTVQTMKDDFTNTVVASEKRSAGNSIAILGIFSAVVLVFNSVLSFSGDTIKFFVDGSPYRAIAVVTILGLIVGNSLFALFSHLKYSEILHGDSSSSSHYKNTAIRWINIIMVILLVLNLFAWMCGFVEFRDRKIREREERVQATENIIVETTIDSTPRDVQ